MGCSASLLTGTDLDLPIFDPSSIERPRKVLRLLDAVRAADGLVIASPGYHGSVSGMVKNALDYLEDLRNDQRSYLQDVPVGCIVSAAGWQACGATLAALRAIVHALRGWPTPMGVTFNSTAQAFSGDGTCTDDDLKQNLVEVTRQVIHMARMQRVHSMELGAS
jgi:FMN reductase